MIDKELIQEAKEKLGDSNADVMAEILGIEKYDSKNKKGCCPFHSEKTPSFIYDKKKYRFHCFGCDKSVDIIDTLIECKHFTFNQAAQYLFDLVGMEVPMGEIGVSANRNYKYPELTNADKTPVYNYLKLRGISKEVVDYARLSCDKNGNIEFPFYDKNDVLKTVKLRPSHKIDKDKGDIKTWKQKDTDHENVLFLQNLANFDFPLVICEGEIDALAVVQSGYKNAVSIPFGAGNLKFIDEQWEWLEKFDSIIVCGDNDTAGRKFNKEVISRLGNWRCYALDIPVTVISAKTGKKVAIKDMNEFLYHCGEDEVFRKINETINQPVPTVVDFSDIQEYNLDEVDGVTFGIEELDKGLMRLFDSSVTTVYAKPSAGKTSLMNQLIAETMNNGKPVFLYSQELSNALQANWILYSLAGRRNINSFKSKEGTPYYRVTMSARKEILKYYSGSLFLYRDGESIEISDILKTAEICVRRQGCKLIILDNLTCISCKGCESDLQRQTEIVRKVVQFAITYNVPIVLVSHSRKTHESLGMDDAIGSMNIANLSSRMISMERNVDGGVTVKLIKDRYLGKNGTKFNLNFDYPSRRFFTTEEELNKTYLWDKGECLAENPPVSMALEQMKQKQSDEAEIFGGE